MSVRSAHFKYYIHDGIGTFRVQLIGTLDAADVKELEGCWKTARTTLDNRKFILDVRQLESADDAGQAWIQAMKAEGATLEKNDAETHAASKRPGFFRRLMLGTAAQSVTRVQ